MHLTNETSFFYNRATDCLATDVITGLAPEAIARSCNPAVASAPAPSRSARYTFVPTNRVVEGLREVGWIPVDAQRRNARTPEGQLFGKHLIKFRWAAHIANLAEYCVELLLTNAHDGTSAYCLTAGIFRRICSNGLVVGDSTFETVRFPHRGSSPDRIVEGSLRLVQEVPSIVGRIGELKNRWLGNDEQFDFAERARAIRYPDAAKAPVAADCLLVPRRHEDEGQDLWSVYNRVQENLVRGGIGDGHKTPAGRNRIVRPIRGIDSSLKVNKGLWELATSFLN